MIASDGIAVTRQGAIEIYRSPYTAPCTVVEATDVETFNRVVARADVERIIVDTQVDAVDDDIGRNRSAISNVVFLCRPIDVRSVVAD